jgi:hypothetical protein
MKKIIGSVLIIAGLLSGCSSETSSTTEQPISNETTSKETNQVANEELQLEKDRSAYFRFATQKSKEVAGYLDTISEASREAADDPTVMETTEWKANVVIAWEGIAEVRDEVGNYSGNIPSDLQPAHAMFIASLQKYTEAKDYYYRGVDEYDANYLIHAMDLMDEANAKTNELLVWITDYAKRYDLK